MQYDLAVAVHDAILALGAHRAFAAAAVDVGLIAADDAISASGCRVGCGDETDEEDGAPHF
jgi:hypothetical protein